MLFFFFFLLRGKAEFYLSRKEKSRKGPHTWEGSQAEHLKSPLFWSFIKTLIFWLTISPLCLSVTSSLVGWMPLPANECHGGQGGEWIVHFLLFFPHQLWSPSILSGHGSCAIHILSSFKAWASSFKTPHTYLSLHCVLESLHQVLLSLFCLTIFYLLTSSLNLT